ncbi:MAG: DUF4843 domain-containing protein [Pedobacter sp.]|nr:MAG: DUF4843 domain-containing protein [Pedobacter sp.]
MEFLRIGTSEVDFRIKVMITGPVKDYDRTFNIEVNPDSTTAILDQHYEAIKQQWTLPAGAVSTNISIRLKRTPDLDNTERKLGLRLVATPQLALSFPEWDAIPTLTGGTIVPEFDASLHTLLINNIMVTPAVWSGSIQQGNRESGLLGVFSKKKMQFLEEVTGVKYEDFASAETMPMARMNSIYKDGERVLIERYNAKNPVLEDDGRLMWMGSVPWMSYIGVPWVPAP